MLYLGRQNQAISSADKIGRFLHVTWRIFVGRFCQAILSADKIGRFCRSSDFPLSVFQDLLEAHKGLEKNTKTAVTYDIWRVWYNAQCSSKKKEMPNISKFISSLAVCRSVRLTMLVLHVVYFKPSPPGKFDYPEVSFLLTLKDQTYFPRLSKIRNIKNKKSSILE